MKKIVSCIISLTRKVYFPADVVSTLKWRDSWEGSSHRVIAISLIRRVTVWSGRITATRHLEQGDSVHLINFATCCLYFYGNSTWCLEGLTDRPTDRDWTPAAGQKEVWAGGLTTSPSVRPSWLRRGWFSSAQSVTGSQKLAVRSLPSVG